MVTKPHRIVALHLELEGPHPNIEILRMAIERVAVDSGLEIKRAEIVIGDGVVVER